MLGHVFTDAGQFAELLVVFGEIFNALVDVVEQFGGFFIAAITPDDRAVDFEQLRRFAQDFCYFSVFHSSSCNRELLQVSAGHRKRQSWAMVVSAESRNQMPA